MKTENENTAEKDKRLEDIQEQILRYAMKDFSMRLEVSGKGDDIDAIIAGLNVLGEELAYKN